MHHSCDTFVDGGWCRFGVPLKCPAENMLISVEAAPVAQFTFPKAIQSPAPPPPRDLWKIVPSPLPKPPGISQYPPPSTWIFEENPSEYLRGGCYTAFRTPDRRPTLRQATLFLGKHPANLPVKQHGPDGKLKLALPRDLQGLVQMELGIPYYQALEYRQRERSLIALTHTPDSLRSQYPGSNGMGGFTAGIMDEILRNVLYVGPGESDYWIKDSTLKENDRSVSRGTGEGCFSLAGTMLQGEAEGVFVPAVQSALTLVQTRSKDLFALLSVLYRHMCIMGKRADLLLAGAAEHLINNVPSIGDGEWGPTSVQMNIHFSDREFSETIGIDQSEPHPDDKDDPCHPAMLVHITTTPYGVFMFIHTPCYSVNVRFPSRASTYILPNMASCLKLLPLFRSR